MRAWGGQWRKGEGDLLQGSSSTQSHGLLLSWQEMFKYNSGHFCFYRDMDCAWDLAPGRDPLSSGVL